MTVARPTSPGARTRGKPRGVMRTSSSVNAGRESTSLAVKGSATNAASSSCPATRASSAPVVPVASSIRTSGYAR